MALLPLALIFFGIALVAGLLGFSGLASGLGFIARILLFILAIALIISIVTYFFNDMAIVRTT